MSHDDTAGSARLITAGIDVGSSSVKTVVMEHGFSTSDAELGPGGGKDSTARRASPDPVAEGNNAAPRENAGHAGAQSAAILASHAERIRRRELRWVIDESFRAALAEAGVERRELAYVATTGEGELVEYRRGHFFGMTTHARGGLYLEPQARAVLDVGALHARAVRMDERSKVLGYRMTSQCASGSGQFLENIARYLGVALEEVGSLSVEGKSPETVSSICAVLAETDVINMVSRGIQVRDILKGIHLSMAGRFVRLLAATGATGTVAVTGGLATDIGLLTALREEAAKQRVSVELNAPAGAIHAGAIGAALWGAFRHRRLASRGVNGSQAA